MTVITVSNSAQLNAAISNAHSGDTIKLAAGTYSNVMVRGVNNSGNVTITSADAKNPAVFSDLTVNNSSGLTFSNVTFASADSAPDNVFNVASCNRVAFNAVDVHGTPGLGSSNTQSPFMIRNSTNVSVTNSTFHDVQHALSILNNTGVTISGNEFRNIRQWGVSGGGDSNVLISNNLFTDFHPAAGDHPDAIILWTTHTSSSASNITISQNLVKRGSGDAIQGIFLRDQVGNLPFVNVTINDNFVEGAMYNAIALNGVAGGSITNNTILSEGDMYSWLRVQSDTGVTVSNNVSTGLLFTNDAAKRIASNTLTSDVTDKGAAEARGWLAAHPGFKGAWGSSSAVASRLNLANVASSNSIVAVAHPLNIHGTVGGVAALSALAPNAAVKTVLAGDSKTLISGNAGADNYILSSQNNVQGEHFTITNFNPQKDVIDLSLLNPTTLGGEYTAFKFIGSNPFDGVAGEVRFVRNSGGIEVTIDLDGGKAADVSISLPGLKSTTASSFVL